MNCSLSFQQALAFKELTMDASWGSAGEVGTTYMESGLEKIEGDQRERERNICGLVQATLRKNFPDGREGWTGSQPVLQSQ